MYAICQNLIARVRDGIGVFSGYLRFTRFTVVVRSIPTCVFMWW
jgi:hypothetical protein